MADPKNSSDTTVTVPSWASVNGGVVPAGATTVITLGYAAEGDGGGAKYVLNTDGTTRTGDIVAAYGRRFQLAESQIDPRMFGAKADVISLNNAQMTSGSATLSASLGVTGWTGFTSADVGKYVGVAGAGAAVAAWGWFRVTRTPTATDTISVNGNTITWVASGAGASQINVGTDIPTSAANLVTYITTNTVALGVTAVQDGADVKITANATGTSGNSIVIASSAGDIESPRVEVRGPNTASALLWGGVANGYLTGTILSVTDSTHAVLSVAASATVSNVRWDFGTDDSAAIAAAIAAASTINYSTRSTVLTAGRYPNDTTRFGNFTAGVGVVVLRSVAGHRARFGVLSPVDLGTGVHLSFEGASLAALPGFTGKEVLGTDTTQDNVRSIAWNTHIECNGYADWGIWLRTAAWFDFPGGIYSHGARLGVVRLGYASLLPTVTSAALNVSIPSITHQVIGSTAATTINDPAGIAVWTEANATDCQIGPVDGEGYRTGIRNEGSSCDFYGKTHVWGHTNTGSMNVGADLRSNGKFAHLYLDSPGKHTVGADPTTPTFAYAVKIRGAPKIRVLQAFLNTGAMPIVDGDCQLIRQYSQAGSGEPIIDMIETATANSSFRFNQIIEYATQASKLHLKTLSKDLGPGSYVSDNLWTANEFGGYGPPYISLQWFKPPEIGQPVAGATGTSATQRMVPFLLRRPVTIDSLAIRMSTAAGNADIAIYGTNPATMLPKSTPLYSSGTFDVSTGTTKTVAAVTTNFPAGLYWFALNNDNTSAAFMAVNGAQFSGMQWILGDNGTINTGGNITGLSIASTFLTWLDLTSKVRGDYTEISTALAPTFEFKAA